MRAPSGDQAGLPSSPGLLVTLLRPEPSEFITYISGFPSRSDSKAICLPSGDHDGCASRSGWSVSLVMPDPSGLILYMSGFPSTARLNTIRPEGDRSTCTIIPAAPQRDASSGYEGATTYPSAIAWSS